MQFMQLVQIVDSEKFRFYLIYLVNYGISENLEIKIAFLKKKDTRKSHHLRGSFWMYTVLTNSTGKRILVCHLLYIP